MSTFTLTFYRTNFRRDEHCIYDDLESALATFTDQMTIADFQYLKQTDSILRTIKVNYEQSYYADGVKSYDYLRAKNNSTGNVLYYYINGVKWIAESTAEFTLELDVLNSYRAFCVFNDNTHITRKFKDRWESYTISKKPFTKVVRPLIDWYQDTIDTPPLWKTSETVISDGPCWYIVSKTEYETNQVENNPVSTYLLSDDKIAIENTPVTIYPNDIPDYVYVLEQSSQVRRITINRTIKGVSTDTTYDISTSNTYWCGWYWAKSDTISLYLLNPTGIEETINGINYIKLELVDHVFKQDLDFNPSEHDLTQVDYSQIIYYYSQGSITVLPFADWYEQNQTDSRLVNIRCVPYQPIDLETLTLGKDYQATSSGLKILNSNIKFTNSFNDTVSEDIINYDVFLKSKWNYKYETKLLSSQFRTIKYVYDKESWAFLSEYANYMDDQSRLKLVDINYYVATEMSNDIAFKFTVSGMKYDTDYGQWLFSTRDLSIPYYTNDYVNYKKYGESYDWSNFAWTLTKQITGGVGSTITTGTSMAAMAAKAGQSAISFNPAGIIGYSVGAFTTAVSVTSSAIMMRNSINQKIDALKHQASTASSTNSMSLFKEYGKNKLVKMIYEPVDEMKEMIGKYFNYYGYACDCYEIPTNSRYWYDYFEAEVEFSKDCELSLTLKNEIRNQYLEGVRIYHWHDTYDLDLENNNYELSLIEEE